MALVELEVEPGVPVELEASPVELEVASGGCPVPTALPAVLELLEAPPVELEASVLPLPLPSPVPDAGRPSEANVQLASMTNMIRRIQTA